MFVFIRWSFHEFYSQSYVTFVWGHILHMNKKITPFQTDKASVSQQWFRGKLVWGLQSYEYLSLSSKGIETVDGIEIYKWTQVQALFSEIVLWWQYGRSETRGDLWLIKRSGRSCLSYDFFF